MVLALVRALFLGVKSPSKPFHNLHFTTSMMFSISRTLLFSLLALSSFAEGPESQAKPAELVRLQSGLTISLT